MDFFIGLGIGDYVFLVLSAFGLLIIIVNFNERDVILVTVVWLTPLLISWYFFYMQNGIYQAKLLTENGMTIGDGTKQSEKFDFKLTDDKLVLYDLSHYKFSKKESNLYNRVYTNPVFYKIKITGMGNVVMINSDNEVVKSLKVFN